MTVCVDHRVGAGGEREPLQGRGHAVQPLQQVGWLEVQVCHACRDVRPDTADNADQSRGRTSRGSRRTSRVRTRDEIAALFDGFTLVEPGLVWIPEWRPDSPADVPENPEQFWALVGVARLTTERDA